MIYKDLHLRPRPGDRYQLLRDYEWMGVRVPAGYLTNGANTAGLMISSISASGFLVSGNGPRGCGMAPSVPITLSSMGVDDVRHRLRDRP